MAPCTLRRSPGVPLQSPSTLHPLPYIPRVFPFIPVHSSGILHPVPCIPIHFPGTLYTYLYIHLAFPCFPLPLCTNFHPSLHSPGTFNTPLHLSGIPLLSYICQALWTHSISFPCHSAAFPWHFVPTSMRYPGIPCIILAHFTHSLTSPWHSPAFPWHFAPTPIHSTGIPCITLHTAATLLTRPYIPPEFPCIHLAPTPTRSPEICFFPRYSPGPMRHHHTVQNAYLFRK